MAFLEWRDKMSVGNEAMDIDHQKLVGYLNDLHDMMSGIPNPESVERLLDKLVDFTEYHFGTEERLLRLCRYPHLDDHKESHKELVKQLMEIRDGYRENPSERRLIQMFDFLSNWLMRHILREDMAYKDYIVKK